MNNVLYIEKSNFNDVLNKVVQTILNEKIVIIPTDTIYGFSALPQCEDKIREIKKRDAKPFLYLISKIKQLNYFNINERKYINVLKKNWPNPITFLMNNCFNKKIGIRLPNNRFLTKMIDKIDIPIISTSVNYSGEPLIENIEDIVKEFSDKVELIVINKIFSGNIASTIVDISEENYKIIREGAVKFIC